MDGREQARALMDAVNRLEPPEPDIVIRRYYWGRGIKRPKGRRMKTFFYYGDRMPGELPQSSVKDFCRDDRATMIFRELSLEGELSDYELYGDYVREDGGVTGQWICNFQMPEDSEGERVEVNMTVQKQGCDILIESVTKTKTMLVVDYSMSREATMSLAALGEPELNFRLYDANGDEMYNVFVANGPLITPPGYVDMNRPRVPSQAVFRCGCDGGAAELRAYEDPVDGKELWRTRLD